MVNEAKLTAIYEEAEGSGYIGYIAELHGVNTQGETLDEAPESLLEAMRMILEANREEAESRLFDKPGITREQLTLRAA